MHESQELVANVARYHVHKDTISKLTLIKDFLEDWACSTCLLQNPESPPIHVFAFHAIDQMMFLSCMRALHQLWILGLTTTSLIELLDQPAGARWFLYREAAWCLSTSTPVLLAQRKSVHWILMHTDEQIKWCLIQMQTSRSCCHVLQHLMGFVVYREWS